MRLRRPSRNAEGTAAEAADSTGAEAVDSMEAEAAVFTEVEAASAEVARSMAEVGDFTAVAASAAADMGAIAEGLAQDVPTHRQLAEAATDGREDSAARTAAATDMGRDVMAGPTAAAPIAVVTGMVLDAMARTGRAREWVALGRRARDSAHQEREIILQWPPADGMVLGSRPARVAHKPEALAQGRAQGLKARQQARLVGIRSGALRRYAAVLRFRLASRRGRARSAQLPAGV